MAKASDNPFPSVLVVEGTAPAAPASGRQRLFIDSADNKLKRVNSAATVTTVEGAGATLTTANAQQGADIALAAATYTNIVSVSLAAGTWNIWGWVTAGNVAGASDQYAQIWDGAAQLGQAVIRNPNAGVNDYITIPVFAPSVVLSATTTIYLRCYSDAAATAYGSTSLGAGGGSKIHALKIA